MPSVTSRRWNSRRRMKPLWNCNDMIIERQSSSRGVQGLKHNLVDDPTEAAVAAAGVPAVAVVAVGLVRRAGSSGKWLRCSFCSVFLSLFSPSAPSAALVAARHNLRRSLAVRSCGSSSKTDPPRVSPPHHVPLSAHCLLRCLG